MRNFYPVFALAFLSLFHCSLTFALLKPSDYPEDRVQDILFHLKPSPFNYSFKLKNQLDDLIDKIDTDFNESDVGQFYRLLEAEEDKNYLALATYHNWGLGVSQDQRIGMLNLNLGVIDKHDLSLLSFKFKSQYGLNTPKSCRANLPFLRNSATDIAKSLSLFERKEGSMIYINPTLENPDKGILQEMAYNLDEIGRSNPKQLSLFFDFYLTASFSRTPQLTQTSIRFLELFYLSTQSNTAASFLGLLYLDSQDSESYSNALKYLEIGASGKHAHAYLGLGVAYFYGLGVDVNYDEAFKFFSLANASGRSEASSYLGVCYLAGYGVESDTRLALQHIMAGANQGYLLSLYVLGFMHEMGLGVFHSCERAAELFSVIVDHKLLKHYVSTAVLDYRSNHRLRAFYKLLVLSELGSAYSLLNAAHIAETTPFAFYSSDVQNKNSFTLWKFASKLGNPKATIKVGDCYFYGNGVEQDYKDAFESYQTAAAYHDAEAIFNIAYMYEHGYGVIKNYEAARRYYMASSEFDQKIKTLVSLALFKLRIKSLNSMLFNDVWFYSKSFQGLYHAAFQFFSADFEMVFITIATIIILFLVRIQFLNPAIPN